MLRALPRLSLRGVWIGVSPVSNAPSSSLRTRRSLLAAAIGAGAGVIASALGRPLPATAANGNAVTVGGSFTGTTATIIDTSPGSGTAIFGISGSGPGVSGGSVSAQGVLGGSDSGVGVQGNSNTGIGIKGIGSAGGVDGISTSGPGVHGYSTNGMGVDGYSDGSSPFGLPFSGAGVRGVSIAGSGVVGYASSSGPGGLETPGNRSGVFGYSNADSNAVGVYGKTLSGVGLKGEAFAGTGVHAMAQSGTALHVDGKASFSRSGRALVGVGKAYVDVTVPGGVAATALCFANLTVYRSGVSVAAVRPAYPAAGKMRIYLSKALATKTYVAWIVMG